MKSEFIDYLRDIGQTSDMIAEIKSIYIESEDFFPEPIESIFVDNYLSGSSPTTLNLFSKNYHTYIQKLSGGTLTLNVSQINGNYKFLRFWKGITERKIPSDDSKFISKEAIPTLDVDLDLSYENRIIFKSVGNNCKYLNNIIQKYINRTKDVNPYNGPSTDIK